MEWTILLLIYTFAQKTKSITTARKSILKQVKISSLVVKMRLCFRDFSVRNTKIYKNCKLRKRILSLF